jgi:hypothetical protein
MPTFVDLMKEYGRHHPAERALDKALDLVDEWDP